VACDVDLDHALERQTGDERIRIEAVVLRIHVHVVHVEQEARVARLEHALQELQLRHLWLAGVYVVGDVFDRERPLQLGFDAPRALGYAAHVFGAELEWQELVQDALASAEKHK